MNCQRPHRWGEKRPSNKCLQHWDHIRGLESRNSRGTVAQQHSTLKVELYRLDGWCHFWHGSTHDSPLYQLVGSRHRSLPIIVRLVVAADCPLCPTDVMYKDMLESIVVFQTKELIQPICRHSWQSCIGCNEHSVVRHKYRKVNENSRGSYWERWWKSEIEMCGCVDDVHRVITGEWKMKRCRLSLDAARRKKKSRDLVEGDETVELVDYASCRSVGDEMTRWSRDRL